MEICIIEKPKTTQLQVDVYELLKEMNLYPRKHVAFEDGQITIDLMIDLDGQLLAIQAEDESFFSVSEPKAVVFKKIFQQQLLENRGFTVVSVPFYEWDLQTTQQSKESYLARKLEKARDSVQMLALSGQ
eukprot:TRINITY_DN86382_c0_g1_i2.p2 TRINITY_DN86382_c0_g1~~TRINITY_DN86382_c0_g1_i2.p2  ORF type:complete len:130 (-),score=19.09 TRINITY_DN86382_c0_g1_i2:107-496(-)